MFLSALAASHTKQRNYQFDLNATCVFTGVQAHAGCFGLFGPHELLTLWFLQFAALLFFVSLVVCLQDDTGFSRFCHLLFLLVGRLQFKTADIFVLWSIFIFLP